MISIKDVLELRDLGFSADEIRAFAGSDAPVEASAPVKAAPSPKAKRETAKQKKSRLFREQVLGARVPCAYASKSCAGLHFAPNGVGSKQHTTCKPGRAAFDAARA